MSQKQTCPSGSRRSEIAQEEKISRFWNVLQRKYVTDPVSILQEAAEIWEVPVFAHLPDTDGPFYSHHACSLEDCQKAVTFLDEYTDVLVSDVAQVKHFLSELPDELSQLYPGGLIACQFTHNCMVTGYIAFGGQQPFTSMDNMFLLNLHGILSVQFATDQYIEINKGIVNTLLFRAMLEGKSADMDLSPVQTFIDKLPKGDTWCNHIMLVECNTDSRNRLQFLRETCNTMVTCSLRIVYEGRIVILYHGRSKYPLQEHHIFTEYLRSNGLKCSISQGFSALDDVPKYYAQAKTALSLGPKLSPGNVLFTYETCAPFHAIQLAADTIGIDALQSPRLLALKNYDAAKGTELFKTLRLYLENISDISSIASELNIHRNTLFHRLKKIEEITEWNLNDGKNLDDIYFSLRVMDVTDII